MCQLEGICHFPLTYGFAGIPLLFQQRPLELQAVIFQPLELQAVISQPLELQAVDLSTIQQFLVVLRYNTAPKSLSPLYLLIPVAIYLSEYTLILPNQLHHPPFST